MPTSPLLEPKQKIRTTGHGERYNVILFNDDYNTMDHVLITLMTVIGLTPEQALDVMMTAHTEGTAIAATTHKEHAEAYREGLENAGLTATIEPA